MRLAIGNFAQDFDLINPSFYFPFHEELDKWSRTNSSSKLLIWHSATGDVVLNFSIMPDLHQSRCIS